MIQLGPGGENLFVCSDYSHLKLVDLNDGTTLNDFGKHYQNDKNRHNLYSNQTILVNRDGKHLFTSSGDGG